MKDKFNKQILDFCLENSYHIHFDMMPDSDFFRQPSDKNMMWFRDNLNKLISFAYKPEEYTHTDGEIIKILLVELEYREKNLTQLVLFKMQYSHHQEFEKLLEI